MDTDEVSGSSMTESATRSNEVLRKRPDSASVEGGIGLGVVYLEQVVESSDFQDSTHG